MSNWFHRNPLKATSKVSFELGSVAESIAARSICNDAATFRAGLLKLLSDPGIGTEMLLNKTKQYVSLLMGFVNPPENSQDTENQLRNHFSFKWSNSVNLKHTPPIVDSDVLFEVCSMVFNVALWLSKHAAKVAAQDEISQSDALEVHSSLRQAAGIFQFLRDQAVPNLLRQPKVGQDLHNDILDAYLEQSKAEAQEITVARAIEQKHQPSLIAGLARLTASIYEKAGLALRLCDPKVMGKWTKYLEFKRHCYEACAYVYFSESLLKEEKVGAGIAVIADAEKEYKIAVELGKAYGKSDGVGLSAKPAEHCFFRRLGQLVENTRRKLERENSIIFHQRVQTVAPEFNLTATYGVVEPKAPEFDLTPDPRWKDAYMGFNQKKLLESIVQKNAKKDKKGKTEQEAPVEAIPEKPIFSTDKEPKNDSGCTIS